MRRRVKDIYDPSTEDVHLSSNGAQLIAVLCFVANPAGVVYLGEGSYLIDTKVFALTLGFRSHGAERLHRALRALHRIGIITGISYAKLNTGTEDPSMCTVQLPPLVNNFGTRAACPNTGNLGEQIFNLQQAARGEDLAISQMEHAMHAAREHWADVAYIAGAEWQNGFFNPTMFRDADRLLKAYRRIGRRAITARNAQHDRLPGQKKRWVEFRDRPEELSPSRLKAALTWERRVNEYLRALPDKDPNNDQQELYPATPTSEHYERIKARRKAKLVRQQRTGGIPRRTQPSSTV
jgi:hypothetical protein